MRTLGWIFALALLLGPSLQEAHAAACALAEAAQVEGLAACEPNAPHLHDSDAPEKTHDSARCVLCHPAPALDAAAPAAFEAPLDASGSRPARRSATLHLDVFAAHRSRAPPLRSGR